MTNDKGAERVPFCCDYHDRYGDHCLFQYQTARPPKASDAAQRILNEVTVAGAAIPSWNTNQRQQSEVKILAVIDTALTAARTEAREAAFRDAKAALQTPAPGTMASTEFHKGFESMRRLGIRAIEAAAKTEEGGGNA